MKTFKQAGLLSVATVAAMNVIAHPGHDHAAIMSAPTHALFYFSIAAVVAIGGFVGYKKLAKAKSIK